MNMTLNFMLAQFNPKFSSRFILRSSSKANTRLAPSHFLSAKQ